LVEQISRHQDYLEKNAAAPVTLQKAAKDWYETIYEPLVAIIKNGGLIRHFPGRTLADLYTFISAHQWEHKDHGLRYGIGISRLVPKNMEDFRKNMAKLKESEYPEMLREITAFVLINASAKKEIRLVDKLINLKEVREVHSVHGSVDIIAKIVLRRDLVSSDAETIGDFVHNKVRQLSGVISTQTLIPGYSKIKNTDEN
jgi:DNA-binding Lrp family transcriptional regulator